MNPHGHEPEKSADPDVPPIPGSAADHDLRGRKPRAPGPSWFRILGQLTKVKISVLAALTAGTGYLVFRRAADPGAATASLGVFLLALGACALNQVQDRHLDARMVRTHGRPIPAGRISPSEALGIAILLIAAGFVLLWQQHNAFAALIGLGAVVWYNGVYTHLKRVTAAAVLPGALIGALPPVIGWTAAGGRPLDPHVFALAFFFFIWQVPHFWLLLFGYSEDYESAGLPSLTRRLSRSSFGSLVFIWMLTTVASSLLLPLYLLISSLWIVMGLLACGLWIVLAGFRLKRGPLMDRHLFPAFRAINIYAFLIMALLIADAML